MSYFYVLTSDDFLRWYLPIYFLAFVAICFAWRIWIVYRSTGRNPLRIGSSDTVSGFVGKALLFIAAILVLPIGAFAFFPEQFYRFVPFGFFGDVGSRLFGLLLTLSSLIATAVAQAQMGDSWRIGIDEDNRTALVARGLYRYTRNPIYLGVLAIFIGIFILLPTGATLLALFGAFLLIPIQVRIEEDFLRAKHSTLYMEYCKKSPRWLF